MERPFSLVPVQVFSLFSFLTMKNTTNTLLADGWQEPRLRSGGCTGCWAAGYCAAFSPASSQPPTSCPLGDTAAERPARRRDEVQR